MKWFSSDFHFGHSNIAGPKVSNWSGGYRDFDSVHEMNKTLTETINKYVQENDELYFLGDFGFGGHTNIPKYRESIKCKTIHVCLGNHDHQLKKHYKSLFTRVEDVIWEMVDGQEMFLSHYSHQIWPGSHKGVIHLFGHSHDTLKGIGKSMDVGVDVAYRLFGEYRPFSLPEVIKLLNEKDIAFVDHHDSKTNTR